MKRDALGRVITSDPIDATAARVVSRGPQWVELDSNPADVCSAVPLPTRKVASDWRTFQDLTGSVRGWLTVIGLAAYRKRTARECKAYWVCRCVCGSYTFRTSRAIKNVANNDACAKCHKVRRLRFVAEAR